MTNPTPTPRDVSSIDQKVNSIGSTMLFAEAVTAVGTAVDVPNALVFYAGGRGGVLGAVPWQQIQSAFAFFPAEIVSSTWDQVLDWGDPPTMSNHYAQGLSEYARTTFSEEASATIVELGDLVCGGVVPMGYPLFTGWRAMARPGDSGGDAALAIMALRELRGDIHIQDIAAAGIHPLDAEVVARGSDGVVLHGWQPPYPDPALHVSAVRAATDTTSERMTTIYDNVLTSQQWSEFSDAVSKVFDDIQP